MIVRTASVALVHGADSAAKKGIFVVLKEHIILPSSSKGLRIASPCYSFTFDSCRISKSCSSINASLAQRRDEVGGSMVVAVGYAMVINMMATREVWPFFAIGFALAAVSGLSLIAFGTIGVALALIYINLSKKGGNGGGAVASSNDPIGDILEDY